MTMLMLLSEIYLSTVNNCCFTHAIERKKSRSKITQNKTKQKTNNRQKCAVLLTASRKFNYGMHSDVYDPIIYKLGMTIVTIALYMLMPV